MGDNVRFVDGKKFMWDGEEYLDHGKAQAKADEYANNKFEVKIFEDAGKHLVYTRRVVIAQESTPSP